MSVSLDKLKALRRQAGHADAAVAAPPAAALPGPTLPTPDDVAAQAPQVVAVA